MAFQNFEPDFFNSDNTSTCSSVSFATNKITFCLQEMMAHQSALAAEGADEHDQYWELVWANLVSCLTFYSFQSVF